MQLPLEVIFHINALLCSKNSKLRNSSMAESAGYTGTIIADDLIPEILAFLPLKRVTRMQLVSKRWAALITSDLFRLLHRSRHPRLQSSLLIGTEAAGFFLFNPLSNGGRVTPYTFPLPNPKIMSSCYDLMVLQSPRKTQNFFVYNADTKQSTLLNLPHRDYHYIVVDGIHLAYDPLESPHYKIVCIRTTGPRGYTKQSYLIDIYDSETRTWAPCMDPFTPPVDISFRHCTHLNNKIYGLTYESSSIFYLDINTNVIMLLPRPLRTEHNISGICRLSLLQESDGYLYYSYLIWKLEGGSLALWELRKDEDESGFRWFLKYFDRIEQIPGRMVLNSVLGFIRGSEGEEINTLVIQLDHQNVKIMAYSFVDKEYEELLHGVEFRYPEVHPFSVTLH